LQVKTVCSFIGAQAWIDTDQTGGRNPLVEAAQALDFTGGIDPAEAELDALRGPRVADRIEDDPRLQLSRPVAADPDKGVEAGNPTGSFEAFIAMMGGGMGPPAMPGAEQAAQDGGGD